MDKIKQENGSITLFVLVAMLFFVMFLVGMYLISSNSEISQLEGTQAIKKTYEKGLNEIDDIYATLAKKEELAINPPKLTQGMTPVKWNGTTWVDTTVNDIEWYNYEQKKWANVRLEDGSMFVWIPRYAYRINTGWHTATAGRIEIEFLKGTTNYTASGNIISISETSGEENWLISPGFYWDSNNNGEEEEEEALEGIWVAKYQASQKDGKIQVKAGVSSWRGQTIGEYFTACLAMNEEENAKNYGLSTNKEVVEPHLIKNTEWGIVAYLANSYYGINTKLAMNTNEQYITGAGGNASSTTGNETGIFDMSGGAWEFVAAYYAGGTKNLLDNGQILVEAQEKYKNVYDSYHRKYYGDAMYEVTANAQAFGTNAWYSEFSDILRAEYPFLIRGSHIKEGLANSGIFAMFSNSGYQETAGGVIFEEVNGFRPAIVVLK